MKKERLFHVSEENNISKFVPRPSPSTFENLTKNVVFAIGENLLHNYLLPRECPRVSYSFGKNTTFIDKNKYLQKKNFVLVLQDNWIKEINKTSIYLYEFDSKHFKVLDETANYYVSNKIEIPKNKQKITDLIEYLSRIIKLELLIVKDLRKVANEIQQTSLDYSFIRMRNLK